MDTAHTHDRRGTNPFTFHISGAVVIPTSIVTTIADKWLAGDVVCDLSAFVDNVTLTMSMWSLGLLSIERSVQSRDLWLDHVISLFTQLGLQYIGASSAHVHTISQERHEDVANDENEIKFNKISRLTVKIL